MMPSIAINVVRSSANNIVMRRSLLFFLVLISQLCFCQESERIGTLDSAFQKTLKKPSKICDHQMKKNGVDNYEWTKVCGKFSTTQLKFDGVSSIEELIQILEISADTIMSLNPTKRIDFSRFQMVAKFTEFEFYQNQGTNHLYMLSFKGSTVVATSKHVYVIEGEFGLTRDKLFFDYLDLPQEIQYELKRTGVLMNNKNLPLEQ